MLKRGEEYLDVINIGKRERNYDEDIKRPLIVYNHFWLTGKTCLQELTANFQIIFSMLKLCLYIKTTKANGGREAVKRKLLNFIYFSIDWWLYVWFSGKPLWPSQYYSSKIFLCFVLTIYLHSSISSKVYYSGINKNTR